MKPLAILLMLVAGSFSALAADAAGNAPAKQADESVSSTMKAPVSQ